MALKLTVGLVVLWSESGTRTTAACTAIENVKSALTAAFNAIVSIGTMYVCILVLAYK